ncbi:DUF1292 domain-containing protein [Clostridium sp. 19966]|uniref:DUF1292 domain-containing protein n=1 Tax=Clostridium sp. 19966 TaxID=2768166 RepID=UPI0028DE4F5C|nr:DUF1292 domain-containing protein [Clostridium sp. 19966]MDT8716689.1 DUF1292 domain-containing protein [Clostridium sp. 19966]
MEKEKLHNCGCEDEGCGCNENSANSCGCGDSEESSCGCGHDHAHEEDGCGCGHDHGPLLVELEDENGNTIQCEVVDGFEYKDNEYALVQNPEDGSVYLFKVVGEGEEAELTIPEDSEFQEVSAYYQSTLEEE